MDFSLRRFEGSRWRLTASNLVPSVAIDASLPRIDAFRATWYWNRVLGVEKIAIDAQPS
jgi:hypothetical protein